MQGAGGIICLSDTPLINPQYGDVVLKVEITPEDECYSLGNGEHNCWNDIPPERIEVLMPIRKCFMCNTDMEEKIISTEIGWGKYKFTIDDVTAHICPECGEITYSAEEIYRLQELGKSLANLGAEDG